MSRSIHTTHQHLRELQRAHFTSRTEQQRRIDHVRQMLAGKRAIKAQGRQRRARCHLPQAPAGIASIPIEVRDQRECVHYPASAEDVRSVLRMLPPGTLDGLSRIVLCLGAEYQRDLVEADRGYGEPDPLLGRLGSDSLPGVYTGACLGTYYLHDASIWLYAYVYHAATMPDRELRELYLRLQMLMTLMHEVAHHRDGTACDVRGRWVNRPEGKSEWSARKQEYHWTQQFVVPYLEQTYPAATGALVEWVGQHGGVKLPLSSLVDHPDEIPFSTSEAIESLFSAYDRGTPPQEARRDFAHELRYVARFDEALQCIAVVLAEHPEDRQARAFQAGIYERQARYEHAEEVAIAVITEEPACADAWDVLVDVYRAQARWHDLNAAATRAIELSRADGKKPVSVLCARTCARIEIGDVAGATADLEELRQITVRTRSEAVASLHALLLLRTGQYKEALHIAQGRLQRQRSLLPWCGVLIAVRYEAAHRLGRPQEAGTLSARAVKLLRRHGHGQWIDRLIADYGLRIWSKNRI